MSDGKGARLLSLNRVARITDSFIGPKKEYATKTNFLKNQLMGISVCYCCVHLRGHLVFPTVDGTAIEVLIDPKKSGKFEINLRLPLDKVFKRYPATRTRSSRKKCR